MDFGLEVDHNPDSYTVLTVTGDIDMYSSVRIREVLFDLSSQGDRQFVVDLGAVEFIDSAGLGMLIWAMLRLRNLDGELSLARSTPQVLKLLDMTGLLPVIPTYASVEDATAGN